MTRLPARPLAAALERMRGADETTEDLYARAGIASRYISKWRHQPGANITDVTAEIVLTHSPYHWWDVWPPCAAHNAPERACPDCWAYYKARRVFDGEPLPEELR